MLGTSPTELDLLRRWRRSSVTTPSARLEPAESETWARLVLGTDTDHEELRGLVALAARADGEDGRPPSVRQAQLLALADAVEHERRSLVVELMAVAADAHAVGVATRIDRRQRRRLLTARPVIPIAEDRILACAVGPLDGEALDALLGRAFTVAVGRGASTIWLDLSGSEDLDPEWLLDALAQFPQHELAGKLRIELCGVTPLDRWRALLDQRRLANHVGALDPFELI